MKKMMTAIMTVMIMVFLNGTITFAAPEDAKIVVIDGVYVTFDSSYYAETNPDVVASVGMNEDALLQHFINAGRYEGRLPSAPYTQTGTAKLLKEELYGYGSEYMSMPRLPVKVVTHKADGSIYRSEDVAAEVLSQYEFDQYGNIVVEHIGSTHTTYYDGLGNRVSDENNLYPDEPHQPLIYDNIYDSEYRLVQAIGYEEAGLYIFDYTYDEQGKLKEVHGGYKGQEKRTHEYYSYDDAGRIINRVEQIFLEALPFPGYDQDARVGRQFPYEYDELGRIVAIGGYGYTYDDEGNVKTRRITDPERQGVVYWTEYIY